MIYYVAFYNPVQELGKRTANYAGEDKIDYICEALNNIGEEVTILSNTKSIKNKYLHKTEYKESEQKRILMFASLPRKGKILHAIDVVYGYFQLSMYLIWHVKKDDVVLVYHSLGYRDLMRVIKKVVKFRYILEVEELFQYVDRADSSFKKKENVVFDLPDGFIFSNSFLNDRVNIRKRASVVVNGIYKLEQRQENIKTKKLKSVVYAGTFQPQKGVDYVINAAEFLDEAYEVRIIGFGGDEDRQRVLKLVESVNKKSKCKVHFDGTYKGADYIKYLQKCDVGVCIQDTNDMFNMYEFPSKIFSYLSNGLRVVTNKLEQIEHSKVYPYLTIAESTQPEDVANAIKKALIDANSSEVILKKMDAEFKQELAILIKGEELC